MQEISWEKKNDLGTGMHFISVSIFFNPGFYLIVSTGIQICGIYYSSLKSVSLEANGLHKIFEGITEVQLYNNICTCFSLFPVIALEHWTDYSCTQSYGEAKQK